MKGGPFEDLSERAARLEDILVTHELDSRPAKKRNYRREKDALQELAVRLSQDPAEVLPRFVDLAMELTGGSSAGLSLYEAEPEPGIFRWQHLRGDLAAFDGTTTPRDDSPCGVTLDRNGPVLANSPERYYAWIDEAGLAIPEVLLVPMHIGTDTPLGTLWVVADESGHFHKEDARVATDLARFVAIALRITESDKRLRESLKQQELLAREMGHRVKNVFAVTESILRLTAAKAATPDALAESLSSRLRALGEAHALARGTEVGQDSSIDLHELAEAVVNPWNVRRQFALGGPEIDCGPHSASALALVIHELATNAVKYGALTQESGRVLISWRSDGDEVVLEWRESGGPDIEEPPERTGFGTTLIYRTVTRQFGGTVEEQWSADGLVCTMRLAADRLAG